MSEMKVNSAEFDGLVAAVKKSNKEMNLNIEDIPVVSISRDIMISQYWERIVKIKAVLLGYQKLLEKDIADIAAAKEQLIQMDKNNNSFI